MVCTHRFDTEAYALVFTSDATAVSSEDPQQLHSQSFNPLHNTLSTDTHPDHIRASSSTYIPEKKYACEDCDAKFARPCELKVRQLNSECGGSSAHENFQTHATKHTGERPFSCPLCGRKFSTSSNVNRHLKTLHPGQPVPTS